MYKYMIHINDFILPEIRYLVMAYIYKSLRHEEEHRRREEEMIRHREQEELRRQQEGFKPNYMENVSKVLVN